MEYYACLIIILLVVIAVALAIKNNKKDQNKIMDYYKETSADGNQIAQQSLENQKRMIELLEDILKKMKS